MSLRPVSQDNEDESISQEKLDEIMANMHADA